jgi:hypothetical protein
MTNKEYKEACERFRQMSIKYGFTKEEETLGSLRKLLRVFRKGGKGEMMFRKRKLFSKAIWKRAKEQVGNYLIFYNGRGACVINRDEMRPYLVGYPRTFGDWTCTCQDFTYRHRLCKHIALVCQALKRKKPRIK